MKKIVAVGRLKSGPERELCDRYAARLHSTLAVVEIPEARGSREAVQKKDAESLLAACPPNAIVVALDEGGRAIDSAIFARRVKTWEESGAPLIFLIGGAEGLSPLVLKRADFILSFGAMTWPHRLARCLLMEQLYRAHTISTGHPYHRSARPDVT